MSCNTQYSNYSRFRDVDSRLQAIQKFDRSGTIGQVIVSNGTAGLIWVDQGSNQPATPYTYNFDVIIGGILVGSYSFPMTNIDGAYLFSPFSQFSLNTDSSTITIIGNLNINNEQISATVFNGNTIYPLNIIINDNEIILNGNFNNNNIIQFSGIFFI